MPTIFRAFERKVPTTSNGGAVQHFRVGPRGEKSFQGLWRKCAFLPAEAGNGQAGEGKIRGTRRGMKYLSAWRRGLVGG